MRAFFAPTQATTSHPAPVLSRLLQNQHGAQLVEYIIALALLLAAFVAIGAMLKTAAEKRGNEANRTVEYMAPCPTTAPGGSDQCL